jgi:hypothetical protein
MRHHFRGSQVMLHNGKLFFINCGGPLAAQNHHHHYGLICT